MTFTNDLPKGSTTQVPCALTIAGTDPSGGAGIQADLKTFQELKTYGMSVITSVVAQNTTGVQAVHHIPIEMIEQQLNSVFSDMPIHAFKTGMIANEDIMKVIAEKISGQDISYVMDPVMVATSGDPLIAKNARYFLRQNLLPLTSLVTPNIPEAEYLTGETIDTVEAMKDAAVKIVEVFGAGAALVKGGHMEGEAVDFLYDGSNLHTFSAKRIHTKNTHGTGCTYSAAITAYLSQGVSLIDAVGKAKDFVTAAIQHSFSLGAGSGPTNHWATREESVKL
ncbi:bifunctional hydroxymethylpyrimidine kinase/phosphomethylpyrimidine kinase [Virgibacillus profundi]|uniref:Hydroxymethylpyrimidine/phosphomethylpyrimidine kinase n=1 Tax=Virgibacillus profundi TaxID=2024555 RepID=A0A2A2IG19_9BACI|nr:bifunctional hydroxymethylpyrimidine kinase/phosphomethylpyrimidine kinase [Virgibacillus profundi]PAV30492.1 bifunctional hydroxymethylpyrimidine kinase/phosphomethylpyrimidine kinase [Virgibacillus profundi]PXY54664.1 bifunctional hydroxymethylpyrimidine kinase/phosphomethylpyrimidine kinase [Virgibacillus profundi]